MILENIYLRILSIFNSKGKNMYFFRILMTENIFYDCTKDKII